MSVFPLNELTLARLRAQFPARENEREAAYLERLQTDGHVRVLTRVEARDVRTYRQAVRHADERRVPLFIQDPMPAPLDPTKVVRLSRHDARDPHAYRAAKARAHETGAQLVIGDEA